jgi:hypothetical protein
VVGQDVGRGAALTEEHERTEDLVLDHSGDQFENVGCLRLDDRSRETSAEPGGQGAVGAADLVLSPEVQADRACRTRTVVPSASRAGTGGSGSSQKLVIVRVASVGFRAPPPASAGTVPVSRRTPSPFVSPLGQTSHPFTGGGASG